MGTFLVTGATGYIAKHVVLQLLEAGHDVVGSSRSMERDIEMREALGPHLPDGALDRYRTVALDLTSDQGWNEAMQGVDVLVHTASPFPIVQPKDPQALVEPAREGTLRALRAAKAAGIKKVVLTSSTVAIFGGTPDESQTVSEELWTDPEDPAVSAYGLSKTLAERAAWDFVETTDMMLSVINPSFVVGPPLDRNYGSSVQSIERVIRSKDPALPRIGFLTCDVRDVARAHVIAATTDRGAGSRTMIVDRFLTFPEIARIVDAALPDRKIVTRVAPNPIVRILALFDAEIRSILPILGLTARADNSRMRRDLGIEPRDVEESVADTARALVAMGVV